MTDSFEIINGIKCYAPHLALANDDFNVESFESLYKAEEQNFWFRSRNRVIQSLIKNYSSNTGSFLEIGCGTGFVLNGINNAFNFKLYGAEIYLEGLKYAKMRLPEVEFIQLDATSLPFKNEFEGVGAFDVLEHIEDDEAVIRNIYHALKPGGKFYLSVPQYQFMWSYLDDIACHKRRYQEEDLLSKLEAAGFSISYCTSFVFTLFPAMLLSRYLKGRNSQPVSVTEMQANSELNLPSLVNSFFEAALKLDEILIKRRVKLPFGGSLMVVALKN